MIGLILGVLWIVCLVLVVRAFTQMFVEIELEKREENLRVRLNQIVTDANNSFNKIVAKINELNGKVAGTQGKLDKFIHEIGNNGVFNRLKALENKNLFNEDTIAKFDALEDFLKVKPVQNTEKRVVGVPGFHYVKGLKSKLPTVTCEGTLDDDYPF